jgi:hypothetical protein
MLRIRHEKRQPHGREYNQRKKVSRLRASFTHGGSDVEGAELLLSLRAAVFAEF